MQESTTPVKRVMPISSAPRIRSFPRVLKPRECGSRVTFKLIILQLAAVNLNCIWATTRRGRWQVVPEFTSGGSACFGVYSRYSPNVRSRRYLKFTCHTVLTFESTSMFQPHGARLAIVKVLSGDVICFP